VKTYDVGKKPHPRFPQQQKLAAIKPLLSDVIDAAEAYCRTNKLKPVFYNIETKSQPETDNVYHPEPIAFVELIMDVLRAKNIMDRVIIQSFDFRTLQCVHAKYPFLKTAMLIESFDKRDLEGQIKDLGFVPTIYSPDYSLVNEALIKKCHAKNMKVIPWTVDDLETIKKLRGIGVDGIITDYPNLYGKM
jgi:glycerophosphoryl diester phosphodiesterase